MAEQMDRQTRLMSAFGYTPREADFACLLLQGLTITEAAGELGVKVSTGRWYCKQLMSKSGVNRQPLLLMKLLQV